MMPCDVIIVGSGIAGASVAAHLAETRSVIMVERETRPGYHSTGRSAALFSEIYGNPVIRALTRASRQYLYEPPPGFAQSPLIRARGSLFIATAAQLDALRQFAALPDVAPATRPLGPGEARQLCPILKEDHAVGALLEPDSVDLDVHALHDGYLRQFRGRQGRMLYDAPVQALRHDGQNWLVQAGPQTLTAPVVVNAAGAWADELAIMAGLRPLGLTPRRRTALLIDPPPGMTVNEWPMVIDIEEHFYFKPDAGALLLSPADETAVAPCDVQPEEWDIAVAIDRMQAATTLVNPKLRHRWAGLRTFAPDRTPVVGFSDEAPGFFWLAGQGGYGIQTAPALSRAAAGLILRSSLPEELQRAGLLERDLSPARFARSDR